MSYLNDVTLLFHVLSALTFVTALTLICISVFTEKNKLKHEDVSVKNMSSGKIVPLTTREVSIGRGKTSDIVLPYDDVSRDHAVLSCRKDCWYVCDTYSASGTEVNGQKVEKRLRIYDKDVITVGSVYLEFLAPAYPAPAEELLPQDDGSVPISRAAQRQKQQQIDEAEQRKRDIEMLKKQRRRDRNIFVQAKRSTAKFGTLTLAMIFGSVFQCVNFAQVLTATYSRELMLSCAGIFVTEWVYYIVNTLMLRRRGEIEAAGFLLTSIGMMITGSVYPSRVVMQAVTALCGLIFFMLLTWFADDLKRVDDFRIPAAAACLALLAGTLLVGTTVNGAKNWIFLGSFSIQPSEFAKAAFVFVGAATLEKLQSTRSITQYTIFAAACIGCLFLMKDFGTALIFFATFLIIAFMRSGDIKTIFFICAAAVLGAILIVMFKSYILKRFAVYRHIWEPAYFNDAGYQQTRVLIYSASGGLFGVGPGSGLLRGIFAATEDLVFGMLCEEFGMIVAFAIPVFYAVLGICCVKKAATSSSSFYTIASCAAIGMIIVQTCLNVFGVTDFLPLTGVTLPLISRGGSSMAGTWGLLALVKLNNKR